jgi:NAD kinase
MGGVGCRQLNIMQNRHVPQVADSSAHTPRRASAWVCFDGKQRQELLCGDSVRVRMSPNPVPTIDHLEQTSDWFDSLEVRRCTAC